jgi:ubiquinone/menaquinone biosynthesis C-methylase UbiE
MDIDFYQHYAQAAEAARGPAWRYDEMKPCGFNYNNFLLASVYDTYHQMFRDYRQETQEIVGLLGCDPFATVIDMGCGTGAFALHAAPCYHRIHAVDVSKAMLRRARRKARHAGLSNIEFHHGGFLTYEHQGPPADAAVSVAALHHLPDFWKLVGLRRLAAMLQPNGRFYLFDVVFSFDVAQCESAAERFIERMSVHLGPEGRTESEVHLRSEHSTCHWIMEGLLERAGFQIDEADYKDDFLASYVCTKKSEAARAESLTAAQQQLR